MKHELESYKADKPWRELLAKDCSDSEGSPAIEAARKELESKAAGDASASEEKSDAEKGNTEKMNAEKSTGAADSAPRTVTFAKDAVDKLPAGWNAAQTGEGEGSLWKVLADDSAPSKSGFALAQTAAGPSRLFNLCVLDDTHYQNLELSVQFKAVHGETDQGGGVAWRYQDENNYYVCRYNPLEENFRVYKVENGKRTQLQTKESVKFPAGTWHTLSVSQVDDHIECSLDGEKYLDVTDGTFKEAGKVGLWTKADAATNFDQFTVTAR